MAPPLKLYWWAKSPNFGDAISPLIVAHYSGRDVSWASPEDAELFSLGSILQNAARAWRSGNRSARPWVWGSGAMRPVGRGFVADTDFAAVRGPRTRAVLHLEPDTALGDPGLLIAEVIGESIPAGERIGIVPHLSQLDRPVWSELVEKVPGGILIDVRDDARDVCRRIAACRHVFSSSLHGLIVADAYGVGNTWMDPAGIHAEPEFKFEDYAASIGRDIGRPVAPESIPALSAALGDPKPLPYAAGLAGIQTSLAGTFPAALKV